MSRVRDAALMREAVALAWRGDHRQSPNPMVGCVIVAGDRVIGRGWHRRAGEAHAEVAAVAECGEAAVAGAEVFVTLEPCSIVGRTPACADLLGRLRPARVVVAGLDLNPRVSGAGVAHLRAADIEVVVGVEEELARPLSEVFSVHITRGRPWVTLKLAMSLDGRIATAGGESRWITGEIARARGHQLRHEHDAIAVGIGTVLADDPALTARPDGLRQPRRVVFDSTLRTPLVARLLSGADQPPLLLATPAASPDRRGALEAAGAIVMIVDGDAEGRVDAAAALQQLGSLGIGSLLVEGGPTLIGTLHDAGLADRVVAHIAPRLIGGRAPAAIGGHGVAGLADAPPLGDVSLGHAGADVIINGRINGRTAGHPRG